MSRVRNNRDICLRCFGDLGADRVCKRCGKRDDGKPNAPNCLRRRSLLMKRYLIDKPIGEGGFGITYLAWDVPAARRVAIKEYFPSGYVSRDPRTDRMILNAKRHHAASNRGLKRFIDEARHLKSIGELDGIVHVHEFFSANDTAYIVMEYLDGISLKQYVRRKGKLGFGNTLTILKPVILSLAEVHAAGLIHRDVSPDNIIITKTNEVKLIDFGASKDVGPDDRTVSIVLKQGFAPEEQYRLHGEQGPWTDIYALGVTIYYCVTGKLPPESIQRMYDDKIVPPSKMGAAISPSGERALMKALAVFAKDRYRSLEEFMADAYSEDALRDEIAGDGNRSRTAALGKKRDLGIEKRTSARTEALYPDSAEYPSTDDGKTYTRTTATRDGRTYTRTRATTSDTVYPDSRKRKDYTRTTTTEVGSAAINVGLKKRSAPNADVMIGNASRDVNKTETRDRERTNLTPRGEVKARTVGKTNGTEQNGGVAKQKGRSCALPNRKHPELAKSLRSKLKL